MRYAFPEEDPGPPYYARIGVQTDEWAAIPFYRDPSCIPSDFNLLRQFDVPRAFRCRLTVEGFVVWRNGPGQDRAPMQVKSSDAGLVPIWFVRTAELQAATADGMLTVTELASLPSLMTGYASQFNEVLHPEFGAQQPSIRMNAVGTLSDGRSFRIHVVHIHDGDRETKTITIEFD